MPRSRFARSLLLLAGLAVVTYLMISLYLPSSRWLIFGIDKRTGRVRMAEQRVTYLPPYQFFRLKFEKRDGYAQRDGSIRITSQEGVPVTVTFRLRFGVSGDRIPDARRVVDDGFNSWIRARVSEAVAAVASQIPIEDLLSPTGRFTAQRDALRQVVARHLAQSGLQVTAFEIARMEVDRDALLKVKKAELRRDSRSVPTRVAIFAIDGADWDLLDELANDGRIPNIKALTQGGASASLQTIQPTVSSMLGTTVATGLQPDHHGVIDFTDWGHRAPVESYSRHAPALWDIADAFGRQALVTSWWTAWPPTAPNSIFFDEPIEIVRGAVYPDSLAGRAQSLLVLPMTIQYAQARRFLNIAPNEWDRQASVDGDPVNVFRNVLAKTWSDHRVAINLYNDERQRGHDPLVVMVSYEGTDAVNHLFAPYHPPLRDGVSQDGYRKYWPAVANYYSEVDRLLGEWMNVLPRDTTLILMSAYGFRWGKDRPKEPPKGAALSDHRNPGVFIAYGPHVVPSRATHTVSIYDIAPTVLTLLGLPQSMEMPGKPATWMFKDIAPITSVRVVSYSEFISERPAATSAHLDPAKYQRELQAIGHLNDPSRPLTAMMEDQQQTSTAAQAKPLPPDKWGTYAYYNNLGVDLRGKGKLKDAADAFQQAIELNPNRPIPYLNLAMTLFDRQMYSDADDAFLQAIGKGLPNPEQYFIDFAALYRERNMPSRAIELLQKGKETFPQSYLIAANLGSALVDASRYTEGVPELERALGLQPSSTEVLNNLGIFYAKKKDWARALDYWNRSLSIAPGQLQVRQAADSARSRL
jgi:predicted AlkP superfamily phosphohydrolase/phosphomutase/Flp pilus assembly protein TadD